MFQHHVDKVEPRVANVMGPAVVGTIETIGEARWSTPNGTRPAGSLRNADVLIYRPATVVVENAVRGVEPSSNGVIDIWLVGGEVGCDRYLTDATPDFELGQRYVFVLHELTQSQVDTAEPEYSLFFAWPVLDNDMVETPLEGRIALAQVAATLSATDPLP